MRYLAQVEQLSYEFIGLLAEAFGLPRSIMRGFYETDGPTPHRAKVVKYPPLDDLASKFISEAVDARNALFEQATVLASGAGSTAQYYLRVMEKVLKGSEEYITKETAR